METVLRRRYLLLWQFVFLLAGTSWLWASRLNPRLTYRTSLISQYETPAEPYSWLFRAGDLLAGLLLLGVAAYILKHSRRINGWLLLALSAGLICDPLLSTTCHTVGNTCKEYFSISFLFHAIETVFTSSLFFILSVYDSWKRKKVVSIVFAVFQVGYGVLFVSQLADQGHFNTLSQYVYQVVLIGWLAWYCRDILAEKLFPVSQWEKKTARSAIAAWAFLNGVLAIVISLAHINLLGRIKGVYFSGDTAWLAQHGIVAGVIMLYLARHLARGEARARQIFLFLSGVETLKYALVTPNAGLLAFYSLTFGVLFLLRDDFDRGTLPLTWRIRLRDLYFMVSGLLLSAVISLILLDRDNRVSLTTYRAVDHFSDYVFHDRSLPHARISSVLLAHTLSVFIASGLLAVVWILFRPYKPPQAGARDYDRVKRLLENYSTSSEDFFKLWPKDKEYFWSPSDEGFVAYKVAGSTAFGLADPIGNNPKRILAEFNAWCRERRLKICFLPVYPDSRKIYEKSGMESFQIGSSAVISMEKFLNDTIRDKWWRWRINKGRKSGFLYEAARPPHSDEFIKEMRGLSNAWLSGDRAEHGFAMGYFDPDYLQLCTVHSLRAEDGKLVAFANELPQFKRREVLTVDLLRSDPETESMAFLIYKIIESAAEAGNYSRFDLGFVPFAKAKGPLLTIAKNLSADRFSAKGLEQFKNKFDPDWQPNYLTYDGDMADLGVIALNIENVMRPPDLV